MSLLLSILTSLN